MVMCVEFKRNKPYAQNFLFRSRQHSTSLWRNDVADGRTGPDLGTCGAAGNFGSERERTG